MGVVYVRHPGVFSSAPQDSDVHISVRILFASCGEDGCGLCSSTVNAVDGDVPLRRHRKTRRGAAFAVDEFGIVFVVFVLAEFFEF
jgi:hypothetical protein